MVQMGRAAVLAPILLCFLVYAYRDHRLHLAARRVSVSEHALHVVLGLSLFAVTGPAFLGRIHRMTIALAVFFVFGCIDEFAFHRDIPGEESSVHAKEHLLLFLFVFAAFALPGRAE
jgi:hypothetical protein